MWLIIELGILLVILYIFKRHSSDYWPTRGVPTANDRHWFFGNYKEVLLVEKHIAHLHFELYSQYPEAPFLGYYIMNVPALEVRHPALVRTVLTSKFANFSTNGFNIDKKYDRVASWNPFFLSGEDWKMSRGHVTQVLHIAKLKAYLPTMFRIGDEMVKYVRRHCKGSIVNLDLKDLSAMFTADVTANVICGVQTNTFKDRNSLFAKITEEVSRMLTTTAADNFKAYVTDAVPALNRLFQIRFLPKKLESLLISLTRKTINDRTISDSNQNDVYKVMMDFKKTDDKGDEYITGQVFTILLDLYETSSNVLMSTLFALAWHSEFQEKLRSEILALQSETKGEYTTENVEKFKYLDMVICESMRLYSPISVLSRKCTSDCLLSVPGELSLWVTKGTPITIPVASIHVDPKYYKDPYRFDPGRFTDEEINKRPKFTFIPFGEGPKKCLGMRIATLQIKVAIMCIIKNFRLKPSSKTTYPLDIDPRAFLVSRPTRGSWVYFEEIS